MKPQVDRDVEKIYIDLLKSALEHPENWELVNDGYQFASPYINKETNTRFVSNVTNMKDGFPLSMSIYAGRTDVHTLKFKWWNFRIISKILALKNYFENKDENDLFQQKSKTLRTLLGTDIERSLKLKKIKDKL